jgi:prevent-host-death family protein
MATVNMREAKTHLSRLVDRTAAGEEIVTARAGEPVAKLIPASEKTPRIRFGTLASVLSVPDDADAPLPPELLEAFEASV